jgi:hypothetical protein
LLSLQFSIACAERFGLAVAVRAEHTEIFEPVVFAVSVGVVDLDAEGLAPPFAETAKRAPIF